jgi:hypothetical protein
MSWQQQAKGKGHPRTGHKGPEGEQRYISTLSLTSALDGCGWSTPRPSCFTPGKTWYPLYGRLSGPQGRPGTVRNILPPPVFHPQTVQPVASRYKGYGENYLLGSFHNLYSSPTLVKKDSTRQNVATWKNEKWTQQCEWKSTRNEITCAH